LLAPTKERYEAAKVQFENVSTQYKTGLAALFNLKQAKLNFKQAEFDFTSLKIDVRTNYQRLLFLCGYPTTLSELRRAGPTQFTLSPDEGPRLRRTGPPFQNEVYSTIKGRAGPSEEC